MGKAIVSTIIILTILCILSGCARKSYFLTPDGQKFTFYGLSQEKVTLETDGYKVIFDRKGRPSLLEAVAAGTMRNLPNLTIEE
jgi:hypothetical protein